MFTDLITFCINKIVFFFNVLTLYYAVMLDVCVYDPHFGSHWTPKELLIEVIQNCEAVNMLLMNRPDVFIYLFIFARRGRCRASV